MARSQKTYVGSAAFVGGTFAFFLFYKPIYLSRGQLVLDSVIIAILEATATSVDNLGAAPLLFGAGALRRRGRPLSAIPLAEHSTTFNNFDVVSYSQITSKSPTWTVVIITLRLS